MELKEFQGIIFDKKQMYGDPNYKPVPFEKDLKEVEDQLALIIYSQLFTIDTATLNSDQLMELHEDYKTHCLHRKVNYSGKVTEAQSRVRHQILLKAEELDNVDKKVKLLNFITERSNSEEYMKAVKLLEELGYPKKTFV